MHLKTYLNNNNLTQNKFIQSVKEKTGHQIPQGTLAKWILGTRIPRKRDMLNIYFYHHIFLLIAHLTQLNHYLYLGSLEN